MAVQPRPQPDTQASKTGKSNPLSLSMAEAPAQRQAWLRGGLTAFGLGFIAFTVWQYAFPEGYAGAIAGLNPRAIGQFQEHLPFRFPAPILAATWSLGFRLMLLTLWMSYGLTVLAVWRGAVVKSSRVLGMVIAVSLLVAVVCPPLLTTDSYSYLGYSHLHVLDGLNPYVTTTAPLFAHHDPVTRFLYWQVPTVYGPVWTALTDLIVRGMPGSLWGQIVTVKLVEAGALILTAFAGRRIADHLQPGRGALTLLAIGLNPLLLIEGPGSGHNDLLMMALALGGVALLLQKRPALAGLLLGLSIGIKLITLALLPWLLIECWRRHDRRGRLTAALALAAGALAPAVIGYAAFWHGPETLAALSQRSQYDFDPAAQAQTVRLTAHLVSLGVMHNALPVVTTLIRHSGVLAVYTGLSAWMWRTARNSANGRWLMAWLVFAPCLMFFGMGNPFPWYITWFWPTALLRGDRFSQTVAIGSGLLALAWEALYACLRPL
jgi:hypothetical protein